MFHSILTTPIGNLIIEADSKKVQFIGFRDDIVTPVPNHVSENAKLQFEEYFNGKRKKFDFSFEQPGTDFQQEVWKELLDIPIGKPISYTTLSKKMEAPLAIRAIASANGKNSIMIAVPCHRVIGSNGELVGYSAGLWRKKWLLEHEAKITGIGQSTLELV